MIEPVRIGPCELYCGDCLAVLPTLEAGSVDAVVTDPPYGIVNSFGVQHKKNGVRRLEFAWDGPKVCQIVYGGVRGAVGKLRTPGSAAVFVGLDTVHGVQEILREAKMVPKPFAWVKKCPPPALPGNWWPSGFELGIYAYHRGAWFGDKDTCRSNVFTFDSYRHGQPGKVGHPTQKPTGLMTRLVRGAVKPGSVALDPFMGSGTTAIACIRTGRKFIGVEIDERYFNIACERIRRELSRHPLFQESEP